MKSPVIHNTKFGATIGHIPNVTFPNRIAEMRAAVEEFYGPGSADAVCKAAGADYPLSQIEPLAFAYGFAVGSGKGRYTAPSVVKPIAATPPPPAPKPTFPARFREFKATGKGTAEALSAAVKQFPELHREWLASGCTEKL